MVQQTDQGFLTVKAAKLQGKQSAQRAELIAVTEALKFAGTNRVNIYTDSAYVVTAVHVELPVGVELVLSQHLADHSPMKVKSGCCWKHY